MCAVDMEGVVWRLALVLLSMAVLLEAENGNWMGDRERPRNKEQDRNHHRPRFRETDRNITAGPGHRAVLKCRVDNLGTKTVTWRRYDQEHPLTIGLFTFVGDTRISVDYNQRTNEWSLIIQDVRPDDEGVYSCQISTKHESHNHYDIRLNVDTGLTKPPLATTAQPGSDNSPAVQVTGQAYIERGQPIQLMCNATGKPEPPHNVEWYKDGEEIHSDAQSGIIITKKIETKMLVSMLVVQHSQMTDTGDYVCRSSNHDADTITIHILNVQGPVEKRVQWPWLLKLAMAYGGCHLKTAPMISLDQDKGT